MQPSSSLSAALPAPANDTQPATPQQMRQQRMLAAGLELMPVRVCLLSGEENVKVRQGFHKAVRRAFMQRLATQAKRETQLIYGDKPPEIIDRLRKKRTRALFSYERHHAIPVSLCPVELSPHKNWDDTLAWWQQEAHRRIHAVPPDFHEEIHIYINDQIRQMFGTKALNIKPSRSYEGELLIPYKSATVWLPSANTIEADSLVPFLQRAPQRKGPPARPVLSLRDELLARQSERRRQPIAQSRF